MGIPQKIPVNREFSSFAIIIKILEFFEHKLVDLQKK